MNISINFLIKIITLDLASFCRRCHLIIVSKKISFKEKQAINVDANTLDSFEEQLELVLMQIMNDDFVQTDVVSACEWCDYKTVCKR